MQWLYRNRTMKTAAAGLVLLAALMFGGVASAANPAVQQVSDTALENYLMREQLTLSNQATRLETAGKIVEKTQALIEKLKAAGEDTSTLESALAAYQGQIGSAQSDHDAAASLISAKAGFDADGKVTDRKAARETVRTAGRSLRQAHLTLAQATVNFRNAILTWRTEHR